MSVFGTDGDAQDVCSLCEGFASIYTQNKPYEHSIAIGFIMPHSHLNQLSDVLLGCGTVRERSGRRPQLQVHGVLNHVVVHHFRKQFPQDFYSRNDFVNDVEQLESFFEINLLHVDVIHPDALLLSKFYKC
jgi:hypothetical protein